MRDQGLAGLSSTEPWMRGSHTELDPLRRGVVHALEMAGEDVSRWASGLSDAEMFARPFGVGSVGFHLRHMVRSLDRLMTYADGLALDEAQFGLLGTEMDSGVAADVLEEFRLGLEDAVARVMRVDPASYGEVRGIGRRLLPTTVGGLLVHGAEHTQRHAGQMVTTAKVVLGEG